MTDRQSDTLLQACAYQGSRHECLRRECTLVATLCARNMVCQRHSLKHRSWHAQCRSRAGLSYPGSPHCTGPCKRASHSIKACLVVVSALIERVLLPCAQQGATHSGLDGCCLRDDVADGARDGRCMRWRGLLHMGCSEEWQEQQTHVITGRRVGQFVCAEQAVLAGLQTAGWCRGGWLGLSIMTWHNRHVASEQRGLLNMLLLAARTCVFLDIWPPHHHNVWCDLLQAGGSSSSSGSHLTNSRRLSTNRLLSCTAHCS